MDAFIANIGANMPFSYDDLFQDKYGFFSQCKSLLNETVPPHVQAYFVNLVKQLEEGARNHPTHVVIEGILILVVFYFLFIQRRRDMKKAQLSKKHLPTAEERRTLVEDFRSAPFESDFQKSSNANGHKPVIIHGYDGAHAVVETPLASNQSGEKKLMVNYAGYDFLSLSTDDRVKTIAKDTVRAYGVGSCGPRGFYGSMKPHIDLEEDLAKFLGVHSAIIYSFQFATVSTLIPCFSAKGDTILCDSGVNLVVQKGCTLSRSNVSHFGHNNMEHLEQLMKHQVDTDRKKKRPLFRRFVVTEGLFKNSGDLCPLPKIIDLCKKYKFRLILDDSYGFGVLGKTGRGTPEFLGVAQQDVDIYAGSLSTSLGSVGGFVAGTNMVVDHQRLAATGYVFSASLPPYVTKAGSKALSIIDKEPERVRRLQANAATFRDFFTKKAAALPKCIEMISDSHLKEGNKSPLVHFIHKDKASALKDRPACDAIFETIVEKLAVEQNVLVARAMYNAEEVLTFPPSLKVILKSELSSDEVIKTAEKISDALLKAFN